MTNKCKQCDSNPTIAITDWDNHGGGVISFYFCSYECMKEWVDGEFT